MEKMNNDNLIIDNIPLIHKVIKDMNLYYNTSDEYQEFYDAGLEGLIISAKHYNSSTKPSTFLYVCIKRKILHLIYQSQMDKRKINKESKLSLDQTIGDENNSTLGEIIASDYNLEEEVEKKIKIKAILNEINNMENKKDALCIKMYYGLEGRKPKTNREIAKELGVSQNMVNTRINRALKKIKQKKSYLERKIMMKETYIENKNGEIISLKENEDANKQILKTVNQVLLEQIQTLKKLQFNNKEESKMEIIRSNAITNTSKVLLQSIGLQILTEKQKYKFLERE